MDKLKRTRKQRKKLVNKRLSAFIVDLYIVSAVSKLLIINYFSFMNQIFFITPRSHQLKAALSLSSLNMEIMLIVGACYFIGFNYFNHGQTPGKLIFSLRTYRLDGKELTFGQSVFKTFAYFFSYLSALGFLFAWPTFFSENNRGVPCMVSKTFTDIDNYFDEVAKLEESNKKELEDSKVIELPYIPSDVTEDDQDQAA